MEKYDILGLLQTMIDFFESGNQQTDTVAKAIFESDTAYNTKWTAEIKRYQAGTEWTGLRAPEAELLAKALHFIRRLLEKPEPASDCPIIKYNE